LFSISKTQLNLLFDRDISFEEELFVQSVLVKCYLTNLRELITPFYAIDDQVLINFKKQRVDQLKHNSSKNSPEEIELLQKQIAIHEKNSNSYIASKQKIENTYEAAYEKISSYVNKVANVTGTANTARYLGSFISHKISATTVTSTVTKTTS